MTVGQVCLENLILGYLWLIYIGAYFDPPRPLLSQGGVLPLPNPPLPGAGLTGLCPAFSGKGSEAFALKGCPCSLRSRAAICSIVTGGPYVDGVRDMLRYLAKYVDILGQVCQHTLYGQAATI